MSISDILGTEPIKPENDENKLLEYSLQYPQHCAVHKSEKCMNKEGFTYYKKIRICIQQFKNLTKT